MPTPHFPLPDRAGRSAVHRRSRAGSIRDVAKQMPGRKIREATEIVDAQGVKKYEVEVGRKELYFDEDGKFIR